MQSSTMESESESDNQWESSYSSQSDDNEWEYNEPRPLFQEVLCCFSMKRYKNQHLEVGDKIILPSSSLSQILLTRIKYPLIFKLKTFKSDGVSSYCGVLEFDAKEGNVYLPEWMMRNLGIEDVESIVVSNAESALKGVYMKLQPHVTAFTQLANLRAVSEKVLGDFTCLGRGSTVMIKHNRVDFYFNVLEVSPGDVFSLIDTDCEMEFAMSLDYVEPQSNGVGPIEKVDRGRGEKVQGEVKDF